jgi:dihydropteroate synthase
VFNPRVLDLRSREEIDEELAKVGPQGRGASILASKASFRAVKLHGVGYREANIAKQEMLGSGGDVATEKGVSDFTREAADIIVMGTLQQHRRFITRMKRQAFRCKQLAAELEEALTHFDRSDYLIPIPGRPLDLGRTRVIGILNVTPDSFSDGGRYLEPSRAAERAAEMEAEGAHIIDVGGESTRPGAEPVGAEEEWRRVGPVLKALSRAVTVPISIDTYKAEVARRALAAGACMVNDVMGLRGEGMMEVVADAGVPAIVMHMQGVPGTMQANPTYGDVVSDILAFLRERVSAAGGRGIPRDHLLVDPGIGFGKTLEHNLAILRRLREFRSLGLPIVLGASRKSFLGALTGGGDERLEGSIAAAVVAAANGAHLVRVHDVAATVKALRVADALLDRRGA